MVQCDAFDLLDVVRNETADIVFLDPPFNLGKRYGAKGRKADRLAESDYLSFMQRLLERTIDVLKPGGALYLYHLPRWAFQFASLLHKRLLFRHWIAVSMKNGFVRGQSLYPAHYALLYFTKGLPATFSRPKIAPSRCRHCDEYIKDYGGYKQHIQDGINLSDVWDDLSPVRHQKYKTRKANELPIELPRRVLTISGTPGGVFVDPFAGAGTTLLAARERQMLFVAGDRDHESFDLTVQRLTVSAD
jgi:site-specific DNA-methyltransferase (adenine-specific)